MNTHAYKTSLLQKQHHECLTPTTNLVAERVCETQALRQTTLDAMQTMLDAMDASTNLQHQLRQHLVEQLSEPRSPRGVAEVTFDWDSERLVRDLELELYTRCAALSAQHAALSAQHAALSTQCSALSTQCSGFSIADFSALSTQPGFSIADFWSTQWTAQSTQHSEFSVRCSELSVHYSELSVHYSHTVS